MPADGTTCCCPWCDERQRTTRALERTTTFRGHEDELRRNDSRERAAYGDLLAFLRDRGLVTPLDQTDFDCFAPGGTTGLAALTLLRAWGNSLVERADALRDLEELEAALGKGGL